MKNPSALSRAVELGRRAARVGFDWTEAREVRKKVLEELAEVDAAIEASASRASVAVCAAPEVVEELGDLLFAVANWARHLQVDAEAALAGANAKFARRFAWIGARARERGVALEALSAAQWDALWRDAKATVG
ncbi:MAG: MazG nucleotide pyrophosphohydrolase domain-containing protein [Steroidobacteraceae bacterium]